MSDNPWRPMSDNAFPWDHHKVIIAAFDKDNPGIREIFRCTCAEHGAYFTENTMLSLNEEGWIPYAFRIDDIPERDDKKFPPIWSDYLTEAEDKDAA